MSDSDNAPVKPPRHGCLTAIMVLAGIVLLLPGVCTILLSGGNLRDPIMSAIALTTFFLFMGGIVLIAQALRKR